MTQGLQVSLLLTGLDARLSPESSLAGSEYAVEEADLNTSFGQILADEQVAKPITKRQSVAEISIAASSVGSAEIENEKIPLQNSSKDTVLAPSTEDGELENPAVYFEEEDDVASQWLGLIKQSHIAVTQPRNTFQQHNLVTTQSFSSNEESELVNSVSTTEDEWITQPLVTVKESTAISNALQRVILSSDMVTADESVKNTPSAERLLLSTEIRASKAELNLTKSSIEVHVGQTSSKFGEDFGADQDTSESLNSEMISADAKGNQVAISAENAESAAQLKSTLETAGVKAPESIIKQSANIAAAVASDASDKSAPLQQPIAVAETKMQSDLKVLTNAALTVEVTEPFSEQSQKTLAAANQETIQTIFNGQQVQQVTSSSTANVVDSSNELTPMQAAVVNQGILNKALEKSADATQPNKANTVSSSSFDKASGKTFTAIDTNISKDAQSEQQGQGQQDARQNTGNRIEQIVGQLSGQAQPATATESSNSNGSNARVESFVSALEQQSRAQTAATPAPSLAAHLKQLNLQQQDAAGQLRERVQLMVRQNIQVAEIRLDPAELGQMQIKLNLQQEQATVQFIVQQQQAKELLEQQMPRLRELLQQQGIQLGEGQVQQQSREERQAAEQSAANAKSGEASIEPEAEDQAQTIQVNHSERIVDYYA